MSSSLLNFGLPTFLLTSSLATKANLKILLISILIKLPSNSSLVTWMSVTVSVPQCRLQNCSFVPTRQIPLPRTGPYTFLCIFLSHVANVLLEPSGKVQVSLQYGTLGFVMVLWIVSLTFSHVYCFHYIIIRWQTRVTEEVILYLYRDTIIISNQQTSLLKAWYIVYGT